MQGSPPAATAPPTRPDLSPGARRPSRGGWATLAVLGVIMTVVLGGYFTAAALSEPTGSAVEVAGIVRVRPLSGWAVADRGSLAGRPFVHLTRGSGNLVVVAFGGLGGDVISLARGYADLLSGELSQLSVSQPRTVRLDSGSGSSSGSGLAGVRFGYVGVVAGTGTSIEGEVTAVLAPSGDGVVFEGWAPAGVLSFVLSDIESMIERAEVGGG